VVLSRAYQFTAAFAAHSGRIVAIPIVAVPMLIGHPQFSEGVARELSCGS